MSPLGEAFRRAMERGGATARPSQHPVGRPDGAADAAPGVPERASRRFASAPTQEIPAYPSAPPAGGGGGRTAATLSEPSDQVPASSSRSSQDAVACGASALVSHATCVPTFAEGPLPPGCNELAGLRASLLSLGLDRTPATIMVAGVSSETATTAVAVGLAGELARDLAHRVVLVDANVSRPGVMRMLGVDPVLELADVLEGRASAGEAMIHSETDNLSALVLRPDPVEGCSRATAESFLSDISRQVMAELQSSFDYVVIDAGTVESGAVPRILAGRATGTVLVMESGLALRSASAAKRAIEGGGGRILGAVLAGGRGAPRRSGRREGASSRAFAIPGTAVGGGRGF